MPEEEVVEVVEEGHKGASSVAEEAEVGGADTFAPSPGKFTWAMTAACQGQWTNQDVMYTVSTETWWDDVTMILKLNVVLCL